MEYWLDQVKVNLGGSPRLDDDGNLIMGKTIDMIVEPDGTVYIVRPQSHLC